MTDAPAPAPPKKRFGFKKAAWQTAAPKKDGAEGEGEESMFSHSADFRDIVAEDARRKAEERRKKKEAEEKVKREMEEKLKDARKEEEKLKREVKKEEERLRKKRKVSGEMDWELDEGKGGKRRSNTLSPEGKPHVDNLTSRYESLTKTQSSSAMVIDLGDSDDENDDDDDLYVARQTRPILSEPSALPLCPVPRALSPDIEEGEDPELVELRRRAREQEAARKAQEASKAKEEGNPSPVVQLLMISEIPGTNPLMVKVRLDTTIEKPRDAWCSRQGFTDMQARDIFCTFKMRKIYNTTKVARLGLQDLGNGCVKMDGDETIYDEENLARPTVQMWNVALFKEYAQRKTRDAAMERQAAEPVTHKEHTSEPEPDVSNNIRLILKAKDKKPWKIVVRPDTTIEKLMTQYKNVRDILKEQPITLMFDDERLKPMDVVGDYDIEDGDSLDVYFK